MDELDIKYEEEYLELVKQYIVDYREKLSRNFNEVAHMYKGRYNQVKWGDEDLVSNQQQMIENKRKKLIDLEYKPYFGKFIFKDKEKYSDDVVYIGKTSISASNGETLVTDWRAPVCSLFYEQRFGHTYYDSPSGRIWCDMLKKYLIQIEEGELLDVVDASLVSNDEILTSFLAVNNETRLKNIIASIQTEQNEIIRRPLNTNIIIQGVAGSGKTTVALHRAAYLLYQNDNYTSNDFIIFGPNKYFLNYISLLLPDLDTENINQFTYEDFTKYYFDGKIKIFDTKDIHDERILKILKFKSSIEYKNMIDRFVDDYIERVLSENILLKDNVLFSKEFIKNSVKKDDLPNSIKNLQKFLTSKVKEDREYYCDMFLHPYRVALKQVNSNNSDMNEIISDMNFIKDNLKKNCSTIISNYFKPLKLKPNELYKKFVESIEFIPGFNYEEIMLLKEITLLSIKKRTFGYEELPALLYLNTIFHDPTNDIFNHYRHVLVDEGQDLGEFHYYMLKKIFRNSTFSIFGDIAQSIYPGRGIDNWHQVGKVMEFNNLEYLFLTKSYRATMEITNNANRILNYLNIPTSNPVLRSGKNIEYFKVDDSNEEIELIKILLEDYYEKNYKSFGIICKNPIVCQKKHKMLEKNGINIKLVSGSDEEYVGGVSILPAELSKGLEFDQVLLTDADVDKYDDFNPTDMKLLYVAATRALHELTISYQNELVAPFKQERQKKIKKII